MSLVPYVSFIWFHLNKSKWFHVVFVSFIFDVLIHEEENITESIMIFFEEIINQYSCVFNAIPHSGKIITMKLTTIDFQYQTNRQTNRGN